MKRILIVVTTLVLLLSACTSQTAPTVDPAQAQASVIAAANTMVALTMAALPTTTPIPPTPIPSPILEPSPTILPISTSAFQASPTAVASSGGADTCKHPLDVKSAGPSTLLNIRNKTNGSVTIKIGISTKSVFGQCGYLGWQVRTKDSITVSVPQTGPGPCYWVEAWINDPQKTSYVTGYGLCMNHTGTWHLDIEYGQFILTSP